MDVGESDVGEFNTSAFLKFLFSTLFLTVCCLSLVLYIPRAFGIVISFLLQVFVLPKHTLLTLGSVQISPLQARLFFKDLYYQNENASLRIVDGYFTFDFWAYWFQSPNWTSVKEYMIKESLVGTRCRARANFKFVKGTVVGIEPEKKRVHVQLDTGSGDADTFSDAEDADGWRDEDADEGRASSAETLRELLHTGTAAEDLDGLAAESFRVEEASRPFDLFAASPPHLGSGSVRTHHPHVAGKARWSAFATQGDDAGSNSATAGRKDPFATRVPVMDNRKCSSSTARDGLGEGVAAASRTGTRGDEVVKIFDASDVRIRSRMGLCQLHVNGTRLCVYNATGKYKDLLNGEPHTSAGNTTAGAHGQAVSTASSATGGGRAGTTSGQAASARPEQRGASIGEEEETGGKKAAKKLMKALKGRLQDSRDLDSAEEDSDRHKTASVEAARKLQRHQLKSKSFMQRFFAFIGAIEVELFATTIDIGGANAPHPYFLHITALRGEGKMFLTRDSVCPIDLYRTALDLTLQQVDMRMAQMDSKLTENQVMRNPSLRDRAQLMFRGTAGRLPGTDEAFASATPAVVSSDLIRDFGILVDGKDKGNVHILLYRDTPNVYAGEEIRRDLLPRQGVEIFIDTPTFRYGPWLEYCRFQMWQYFLPPNFRPLPVMEFVVGKPRPVPGIEFFIEFIRETRFEVPFKRRAVAPSPPFGIKASGEKGMLTATVGAGSQYIQKGFFVLPGEDKQVFEALFMGRSVTVWSNCVLGRDTIFCHADSVQLFLDRQDDLIWNGRKLWNILPKLSGAEVYFFMLYVDFFLDLLNDWQFAQNMYHSVPLTTEVFNTYERAVRDFVPNVKRFEVFLDGYATVYLNINHHNVVYAADPCDLSKNVFAILKVQQGSFSMVLPSDQYQLSYENEVIRPLKVTANELKAYVSLPPTHPLYEQVSMEIPFAYCEHGEIDGSFIINVGNQSIPQDRETVIAETGRTKHTNFLNLQIDFTNMHGTLMGPHIKGLIDCFENVFLDNTMTITPDELFWLLAKLQSHATTGKNKRKEFKQYLESKAPIGNDLEISVLVRITDLEATAATSQAKGAPGVLLTTSLLTFTYLKQFACTDTAVVLAPITARLCDAHGRIPRSSTQNFLATGCIRVGLLKHFGRMPLKPKVHEAMEVCVDGISFELGMEQAVVLADVVRTLLAHLQAEDRAWVAEVEEARAVAEYAAEQIWRGPQRRQAEMAATQWRAEHSTSPNAMWDFYHHNNRINRDNRITKMRLAEKGHRGSEFYFYSGAPLTESEERKLAAAASSAPPLSGSPHPTGVSRTREGAEGASGSAIRRDRATVDRTDSGDGDGDGDGDGGDFEMRQATSGTESGEESRETAFSHGGYYNSSGGDGGEWGSPFSTVPALRSGGDGAGASHATSSRARRVDEQRRRSPNDEDDDVDVPLVLPLHSQESEAATTRSRRKRRSLLFTTTVTSQGKGERGAAGEAAAGKTQTHNPSNQNDADSSDRSSDSDGDGSSSVHDGGLSGEPYLAFANSVPRDAALGFAYFMEEYNKAEDDAKDYGIVFLHVVVAKINGAMRVSSDGYVSVDVPNGLSLAQSNVNDGNSNNRTSVAVKDLTVKAFVARDTAFKRYHIPVAEAAELGDFVEALHLRTSLCARQLVAYPFDGSLENHREKQRQFVAANDYEGLIRYAFVDSASPPQPSPPPPQQSTRPSGQRRDPQDTAASAHRRQEGVAERGPPNPPPTARAAPKEDPTERAPSGTPEGPPTLPRPRRAPAAAAASSSANVVHADDGVGAGRRPRHHAAASAPHANNCDGEGTGSPTAGLMEDLSAPGTQRATTDTNGSPNPLSLSFGSPGPGPLESAKLHLATVAMDGKGGRQGPITPLEDPAAKGSNADESLESDRSTTARSVDQLDHTASDLFKTFPSYDPGTAKSDLQTSGARFGTCLSVTEYSDFDDGVNSIDSEMDNLLRANWLRNSAFAADRPTGDDDEQSKGQSHRRHDATLSSNASTDHGKPHQYWLQEAIPAYSFYRTYFKEEPGDTGAATTLDYRVPRRPTRSRPIRNRTHAFAPLPSVAFFQSEAAHVFPDFVTAAVLQREADAAGDRRRSVGGVLAEDDDTPSKHVPFAWALRTADNRERSRNGATTKHFHVETVEPVTILVTRVAAELGAAAAAAFAEASVAHARAVAGRGRQKDSTLMLSLPQNTSLAKGGGRPTKQGRMGFAKQGANKKSRAREKQKRWLSEDSIVSVLVPCVEVKLLTTMPVPVENLPDASKPMEGVYCSTLTLRDTQFYSRQNRPPAGVEVSVYATRRLTASLRVATLALVTQIEHEPICREGNLRVAVPGVYYDTDRDTIGVFYLADVSGSGKQDVVRGAEGGACRVSVDAVSLNWTRDMVDYLLSLKEQALEVRDLITKSLEPLLDDTDTGALGRRVSSPLTDSTNGPRTPAFTPQDRQKERGNRPWTRGGGTSAAAGAPSRGASRAGNGAGPLAAGPRSNPLVRLGLGAGRTVQGKGTVRSIVVNIVDTRKDGRRIKVDLAATTTVELARPTANFMVMTPPRSRDRNVQLQCVGEIDLVRATLYPSVLHVAHHRAPQPADTVGQAGDDWGSLQVSPALSRQSTASPLSLQQVAGQWKSGSRVSFSMANAHGGRRDDLRLPLPLAGAADTASPTMTAAPSSPAASPGGQTKNVPGADRKTQGSVTASAASSVSPRCITETRGGRATNAKPSTSPEAPKSNLFESLNLIYNCSFTLRSLDVSMMHSEMNYAQLKGKNLMGCAESRAERVSSRECIQMEALAEVISEPMRERLRNKARSARERASGSRYAAPPNTTEQQQLKASACFFTQSILVHYMADPVIGVDSSNAKYGSPHEGVKRSAFPAGEGANESLRTRRANMTAEERKQQLLDAQVMVAVVRDVALSAQATSQYDIAGDQTNVAVHVDTILCESPYRPNTGEVIQPQIHQFITAWRRAVKGLSGEQRGARGSRRGGAAAPGGMSAEGRIVEESREGDAGSGGGGGQRTAARRWNTALFLVAHTRTIEAVVRLPQSVTQRFILPELSAFVQSSSDQRASAKVHIHPFTITSKLSDDEPDRPQNYAVTLPNVYLMYAHDAIKVTGTAMVDTVAITVTPLFINHTLLTYEKLSSDLFTVFSNAVPLEEDLSGSPHGSPVLGLRDPTVSSVGSPVRPPGSPPLPPPEEAGGTGDGARGPPPRRRQPTKPAKRQSFLFLVRGVRVSYLTSVTNLRFTVRRVNATADTSAHVAQRSLQWVVHVTNAQVALVDRNDHDQMAAAVHSMTQAQRADGGAGAEGSGPERYASRLRGRTSGAVGKDGPQRDGQLPPSVPRTARHGLSPGREVALTASGGGGGVIVAGGATASTQPTAKTSAVEEARKLRAVHPLSGFIWGSAEFSFTLSSGKMEQSHAKVVLEGNSSFEAYSADLQKALLDALGHSFSQWELSIYSPLIILRFGLEELLKMCFDETRDDINQMKAAAAEESDMFRMQLTKHKTFRKLQSEKRRYEALMNRTEKERMQRLRRMTAQVANDVSRRRGALTLDDEEARTAMDCFNVTNGNLFVATISHFLCVVPFGDAAFRSLLEDAPDTYSCGKLDRHIHSGACLNRRNFIPTLALKMRVEDTSLICALESVKRFVPVMRQGGTTLARSIDYADDTGGGLNGRQRSSGVQTAETDYMSSLSFTGRFLVNNTYLYFTDGSSVEESTNLPDLISDTGVLGGLGILTEYTTGELRQSRNTLHIACIDSPINVQKKGAAMRVGAVLDLTGPRVQLSSRLVNILSELALEAPTERLVCNLHARHRARESTTTGTHVDPNKPTPRAPSSPTPPPPPKKRRQQEAAGDAQEDQPERSPAALDTRESPRLRVDVSARLAAGTVKVYAHTKASAVLTPANGPGTTPPPERASAESKFSRPGGASAALRRVAFAPSQTEGATLSGGSKRRAAQAAGDPSAVFAQAEEAMERLLAIPLPAVMAQMVMDRGGSVYEEDYAAVKIEVRAGTIELNPSIMSLAREIEAWAQVYDEFQLKRRKSILAMVEGMEAEVTNLDIPLHSTLQDVLLPLPFALSNVLSAVRMRTAINLKRASSVRGRGGDAKRSARDGTAPPASSNANDLDAVAGFTITEAKAVSKSFTGIHITLTSFRLILTTEPLASTTFTVFLDDKSSIDLLLKVFRRPTTVSKHFLNKFPDLSATLAVHSLRAECQTKLEVKCLEVSLPEAELTVSKRQGLVGAVTTVSANFPLNVKGTDPNVTLRVQHMSQLLTVVSLWTVTLTDTLQSVKRLTARDAPAGVVAQKMKETPLGHRVKSSATALKATAEVANARVMVAACVSHGLVRVDLGSGNTHQLFFGKGHVALESASHDNGSQGILLILGLLNISIRSEGVLGGVASIGAVSCQAFLLRNEEGGLEFVRSPEGRTFRETLVVQDVIVTFKERQLRDIFECKVESFQANAMDGIGEEGYTTTDLDVSLSHGTLGVTPSTVPAFLNFVRTVSALVADQQCVTSQKLQLVAPHLFKNGSGGNEGGGSGGRQDRDGEAGDGDSRSRAGFTSFLQSGLVSLPLPFPQFGSPAASSRESAASANGERRDGRSSSAVSVGFIPFMGNELVCVPCGQLRFTVESTTVMLGSTSSSPDATVENSVVASFPKARLSFAECPCDDYTAAKKALVIETHNVELYRPGTPRVVIMGFNGVNVFDFYTRQVLGERTVGFTLSLRQTHPWTGNPRFRDFEEMIMLIKSFTDKKNAYVFQRFGQVDADDPIMMAMMRENAATPSLNMVAPAASTGSAARGRPAADTLFNEARTPVQPRPPSSAAGNRSLSPLPMVQRGSSRDFVSHQVVGEAALRDGHGVDAAAGRTEPLLCAAETAEGDVRVLRPLRATKFSPQLRFGGDVSVNTEVILNWLGITENMLPNVLNVQLCDKLEGALSTVAEIASERVVPSPASGGAGATAAKTADKTRAHGD